MLTDTRVRADGHFPAYSSRLGPFIVTFAAMLTAIGCTSDAPTPRPKMATSSTLQDVIAGPMSEEDIVVVSSIVSSLAENDRPQFSPAVEPFDDTGLSAAEILAVYRRQYLAALDVNSQADQWDSQTNLRLACESHGITLSRLALLLTRIGCAHHAAGCGSEVDLAAVRRDSQAKLNDLLPQIDAASSAEERNRLIDSLGAIAAFDAYLTLLHMVPSSNRDLVLKHQEQLGQILPPTPKIAVSPSRRTASREARSTQ